MEERERLEREVGSLGEQVKLLVRAEHAATRSRRAVDRQLVRIRRLAELALDITGVDASSAILEHARRALLDFFELDEVAVLRFDSGEPAEPAELRASGAVVVDAGAPQAEQLLRLLSERGASPPVAAPRVVLWVPLRSRTQQLVGLLTAWTSRANAHHRDLPRAEHLPFLELFGSHVTRALDNAALTAELRQSNQQLHKSLQDLERTQAQLIQAQKLEALGRLSGGIAHDFNNLLTLIVGSANLLRPALQGEPQALDDLEVIVDATRRATGITRRLLAFGRQQEQRQELIDLNALTMDLSRMLRRLVGDDVKLQLDLDSGIRQVAADPVQLEQILMNLVINARDAMPEGGTLTLETRHARTSELPEGLQNAADMVTLRVIDTGIGFDESVKKQLFEPFFTTKPVGKGTGLGLSTVYGLVNQNRGHISVQSAPGQGAAFTVYLPIADKAEALHTSRPSASRGTILIVEDEDGIRRLASRVLRKAGFEVYEARDGVDALQIEARLAELDLIVTDVVMPGMGGPELVRRLRGARARLPVIFMSGHTFDSLDTDALDPRVDHFLPKPFTPDQLLAAVEQMRQGLPAAALRALG